MSNLSKVEIKSDGTSARIFIDGIEIHGVKSFSFSQSVHTVPTISLELFTDKTGIESSCVIKKHINN